jgi:Peptidase family M1 domain
MPFRYSPHLALLAATLGGLSQANAQTVTNTAPPGDTSIFAPLTVPPPPSATRGANGAPGPKYWQNHASYDLQATLDTTTGTIQGKMVLRYTNNSPNTLDYVWFQTEQNRFRNNPDAAGGDTSVASGYGDRFDNFTEDVGGKALSVKIEDHVSVSKMTLPTPLKPGATATFNVTWHFVVPLSGDRMGHEGVLYQIAQWYPRVNVYDDVKGWNIEPYLGTGEFFLEYGDFTLAVTVPSNYVVAATGTLDNPNEVLTPTEISRLHQAATSDTTIRIMTEQELTDGTAHLKHDGMVTWKFDAKNVRDAVFATSSNYQWDASSWHGILAQAYYRPPATGVWDKVADMARMSIQEFSERWYPYPYPQVSVAEGNVGGGMEYPMISFDGTFSETTEYMVVTHEIGHNWFPMIVGSNERMHGWMDEGINTFIDVFSEARRYPENGDFAKRADHQRAQLQNRIRSNSDVVMEVPADSSPDNQYTAYDKPAGVLQTLRNILGPDTFDKALRTYIQRWAYKHPTPQDFFRTMDDVSGQKLDWFWREWFYETPTFDQTIDSVTQTASDNHVTVVYGNKGRGVLPLIVRFTFNDSTTQDFTYSADVWRANSTKYSVSYTFKKPVAQITIDPTHRLIDTDRSNNVWPTKKP